MKNSGNDTEPWHGSVLLYFQRLLLAYHNSFAKCSPTQQPSFRNLSFTSSSHLLPSQLPFVFSPSSSSIMSFCSPLLRTSGSGEESCTPCPSTCCQSLLLAHQHRKCHRLLQSMRCCLPIRYLCTKVKHHVIQVSTLPDSC